LRHDGHDIEGPVPIQIRNFHVDGTGQIQQRMSVELPVAAVFHPDDFALIVAELCHRQIESTIAVEISRAHIGDSRCYRLRGDKLEQRTQDHSLANEYVRMGILSAEDVEYFPYKNVITRACGLTDEVEVDVAYEELEAGDVYMFCSDGLSDMIQPPEIRELMMANPELDEMCRALVERANANGGADNITVVLAKIER